jgi:hypothetical protein
MNSTQLINQVISAQAMERLGFSETLRRNPGEYADYLSQRVGEITDSVLTQKSAAFQKAHVDLGRYMDMEHNANFYQVRNNDVDKLTQGVKTFNESMRGTKDFEKDITKRQFEINEWQNYNKLETLFFLQVFFIAVLAAAIVGYLQKNLFITSSFAGLLLAILVIGVAALGIYRYLYTASTRDTQLWHRRYFKTPENGGAPPVSCDSSGNLVVDSSQVLSAIPAVQQCATSISVRASQLSGQISQDMLNYQAQGTVKGSLLGGLCSAT